MKGRCTSKKYKVPQIRVFVCPTCGTKAVAPKYKRATPIGHIKTMYCFVCKDTTDHAQIE